MKKQKGPKKKITRDAEQTKIRLMRAAKKIFAERGYHGATVQKISESAGVNISLISHHFGGKEGLYRACLQGFGEARLEALQRLMEPPATSEEFRIRVELLVHELLVFHLKEPEITTILLKDVGAQKMWGEELQKTLFSFTATLAGYFEEAKKIGFLKEDAEPLVVAALIYLSFSGLVQVSAEMERVLGVSLKDSEYRKMIVKQTLHIVWYGVLKSGSRLDGQIK